MTDTSLNRQTFLPPWAERLSTAAWVDGYTFIDASGLAGSIQEIHAHLGGIGSVDLALAQAGDFWSCVARIHAPLPALPAFYTQFSVLGFVQLWNSKQAECRLNDRMVSISSLCAAVTQPLVYRHPAMMPMEISFNPDTHVFERAMIYCTARLAA